MDHISDVQLLAAYEDAGLQRCLSCGRLYKTDDGGCDFCGQTEVEEKSTRRSQHDTDFDLLVA